MPSDDEGSDDTGGIASRVDDDPPEEQVGLYEPSQHSEVSATLHRAIRALDEAAWELDRMDADDKRRVTRRLQNDLRIVRTLVEEEAKGNTDFRNYEVEEDRFLRLAERAPGK